MLSALKQHECIEKTYQMTKQQEIANAVTMASPMLALIQAVCEEPHPMSLVILVGTAMHLPVSFTYHLSAAYAQSVRLIL